jgi:hypothetical protein
MDEIILPEGFCDLRGIILVEGLYDWGEAGHAPLSIIPGICLTTEEKHGKPQSG